MRQPNPDKTVQDFIRTRLDEECIGHYGAAQRLSHWLGCTPAYLSRMRNGKVAMSNNFAAKMASYWGISLRQLEQAAASWTPETDTGSVLPHNNDPPGPMTTIAGDASEAKPDAACTIKASEAPNWPSPARAPNEPELAELLEARDTMPELTATLQWCRPIYNRAYLDAYEAEARRVGHDRPRKLWVADIEVRFWDWKMRHPSPGEALRSGIESTPSTRAALVARQQTGRRGVS